MCWSQIPVDPLLRVYQYLEDVDRVRASTSCRHWRNVFFDPSLWRVRTFDIRSPYLHNEQDLVKFVNLFGRHVQHLKIIVPTPSFEDLGNRPHLLFIDTLLKAFNNLDDEKPQLKSFLLSNLYIHNRSCYFQDETDVAVNRLLDTLKDQHLLTELSLKRASIDTPMDVDILQCLGRSGSSKTLEVLDAVELPFNGSKIRSEFSSLFQTCKQLKEIRLKYSYLGRGFNQEAWGSLKNSLRLLVVYSEQSSDYIFEDGDFLGSDWWQQTCQQIPELKVHFHHRYTGDDASDVLVPEIPLVKIVWKEDDSATSTELGKLANLVLYHLAFYFQQSLETATFCVTKDYRSRVSKPAVLSVLSQCKKLKKLEFSPHLMSQQIMEELRAEGDRKYNLDPRVISIM